MLHDGLGDQWVVGSHHHNLRLLGIGRRLRHRMAAAVDGVTILVEDVWLRTTRLS